MAKVVNLSRARKTRARDDRRKHADENAVKFGRTKAQKSLEDNEKFKIERNLDGHKTEN